MKNPIPTNRRALFGLAAAGAIAGPQIAKDIMDGVVPVQPGYPPPPASQRQAYDNAKQCLADGPSKVPDSFWDFSSLSRQVAEREARLIERQIACLMRTRSTSHAYKEFMLNKLEQEKVDIFERCNNLLNAIRESFFK